MQLRRIYYSKRIYSVQKAREYHQYKHKRQENNFNDTRAEVAGVNSAIDGLKFWKLSDILIGYRVHVLIFIGFQVGKSVHYWQMRLLNWLFKYHEIKLNKIETPKLVLI